MNTFGLRSEVAGESGFLFGNLVMDIPDNILGMDIQDNALEMEVEENTEDEG